MNDHYLIHYGIKNQRKGVRRYQNEDGTLTPLGKQRYGIGIHSNGNPFTPSEKIMRSAKNRAEEEARKHAKQYVNNKTSNAKKKAQSAWNDFYEERKALSEKTKRDNYLNTRNAMTEKQKRKQDRYELDTGEISPYNPNREALLKKQEKRRESSKKLDNAIKNVTDTMANGVKFVNDNKDAVFSGNPRRVIVKLGERFITKILDKFKK